MKRIIIYGVGKRLKVLLAGKDDLFDSNDMEIIALCDGDIKKQGLLVYNREVISPALLNQYDYDYIYISSEKYYQEIRQQLISIYEIEEYKIKFLEIGKYNEAFGFWQNNYCNEGKTFGNEHFRKIMLGLAEEPDDEFMRGKIVADFGCGPRGSFAWTEAPLLKLGIDVLADRYWNSFGETLRKHNMVYVTSTENSIPIPDHYVDCLYTINSLDHVDNLETMNRELMRILKRGGVFFASLNLNEPPTETEPQTLTEEIVLNLILKDIDIQSYRMAYPRENNTYENFYQNNLLGEVDKDKPCILWVKGVKK